MSRRNERTFVLLTGETISEDVAIAGAVAAETADAPTGAALARMTVDIDSRIRVGDAPTASTAADTKLVANTVEYMQVTAKQKISVVAADGAAAGTLNVTWFPS